MGEKRWNPADLPEQTGKTVVITGGTSGIGYETALALAKAGACVTIASRNETKGAAVVERIRQAAPGADVTFSQVDTGSQNSVKNFCAGWKGMGKTIDCLILNAGISNVPKREETVDGFERQFATNYLGHFTMTALLLPFLSGDGRIILVSSLSHKRVRLNLDDLQGKRRYSPMKAYCQSKLAVLTFALELSRRLAEHGSKIKVIPVHPGVAATGITRGGDRMNPVFQRLASKIFGIVGQSAAQGAWPILYAATSDMMETGVFYGPSGPGERKGLPGRAQIAPQAADRKTAEKLWKISEQLTEEQISMGKVI